MPNNIDSGHQTSGNLSFGLMKTNLRFLSLAIVFVRGKEVEWIMTRCVAPIMKDRGGCVMV